MELRADTKCRLLCDNGSTMQLNLFLLRTLNSALVPVQAISYRVEDWSRS